MHREEQRIRKILSANKPMKNLTSAEQAKHDAGSFVFHAIENLQITQEERRDIIVCHWKYIAPACQICNLQVKCRKSNECFFVPCFFHNNSAYDSYMIIKHLHSKDAKIRLSNYGRLHLVVCQVGYSVAC